MSLQVAKHFFTIKEFERMGEAGIFSEDARLELIEGEIVEISPIGSRHAACVKRLSMYLSRTLGDKFIIGTQDPIQLDDFTAPQTDIALLQRREDFYESAHPKPQDVLLVIEVADTTLDYDRLIKLPLYARAGIPEVWIVNLPAEKVEIYAGLEAEEYKISSEAGRGDAAHSQTISSLSIPAAMILG